MTKISTLKQKKENRGAIKHIYIYSKYRRKALEKIPIFRINRINTSFIDINFVLKSLPTLENNRPIQKYYDLVLKDLQNSKKIYNLTKNTQRSRKKYDSRCFLGDLTCRKLGLLAIFKSFGQTSVFQGHRSPNIKQFMDLFDSVTYCQSVSAWNAWSMLIHMQVFRWDCSLQ